MLVHGHLFAFARQNIVAPWILYLITNILRINNSLNISYHYSGRVCNSERRTRLPTIIFTSKPSY